MPSLFYASERRPVFHKLLPACHNDLVVYTGPDVIFLRICGGLPALVLCFLFFFFLGFTDHKLFFSYFRFLIVLLEFVLHSPGGNSRSSFSGAQFDLISLGVGLKWRADLALDGLLFSFNVHFPIVS